MSSQPDEMRNCIANTFLELSCQSIASRSLFAVTVLTVITAKTEN